MPGEGGVAATREIAALGLGVKVLVLTALPQDPQLLEAFEAGARGFIEKTASVEELTRAVRGRVLERLRSDGLEFHYPGGATPPGQ